MTKPISDLCPLLERRIKSDWVELEPNDIVRFGDYTILADGTQAMMLDKNTLSVTVWQRQHPGARYFRCMLGTVAIPYRAEHYESPMFAIWRLQFGNSLWIKTAHTVAAKTQEQAQAKVKRMFKNCGFHNMRLVAVPIGQEPK